MKRAWIALLCLIFLFIVPAALAAGYRIGDQSDEIATIQRALTELDLYYADITGRFGTKTKRAVKLFQKKYGLPQTDVADQTTLNRLYAVTDAASPSSSGVISGIVLRKGSEGPAVIALQQQLKAMGYFTGSVTGTYGSLTYEAVRRFQRANNLSGDGIAGRRTLEALAGHIQSTAPSYPASTGSANASTLRRGSQGDAVSELQRNLAALEYYTGSITGSYGDLTYEAVRLFQRANGLSGDGIAGPRTLAAIAGALGKETVTPPASGTVTVPTPAPQLPNLASIDRLNIEWTLRRSSRNGHVTRLQRALTALGYFSGKVDGAFGAQTEQAVIAYQTAKGLKPDGIAGRATLRAINADLASGTVRGEPID